jgi:hypothetical protein
MTTEFKLDWGEITPDGYSEKKNEAVYVFNFNMMSDESRSLAQKFIVGKVLWYQKHLPDKCSHVMDLDLYGQEIGYEFDLMDDWREETLDKIKKDQKKIVLEMNMII